jgi:hypothetical protein
VWAIGVVEGEVLTHAARQSLRHRQPPAAPPRCAPRSSTFLIHGMAYRGASTFPGTPEAIFETWFRDWVTAHPHDNPYGVISERQQPTLELGCEYAYERGLTAAQLPDTGFALSLTQITAPPGAYTCAPFHVSYHDEVGTIRTPPVAGERLCR